MCLLQRTTLRGAPRPGACVSVFLPVIRGYGGPERSKHQNNNNNEMITGETARWVAVVTRAGSQGGSFLTVSFLLALLLADELPGPP